MWSGSAPILGRVVRGFRTRDGEHIWLINWDDGAKRATIDLEEPTPEFNEGDRVALVGRALRHANQRACA